MIHVTFKFRDCLSVLVILAGMFTGNVKLLAQRPSNDNFLNAILLVGTNLTVNGSNVNATKEAGEPNHDGNSGGKSVWWNWQAPATGYITLSTLGSTSITGGQPLDTIMGLYTGSKVSALTEIASNDDGAVDSTSLIKTKVNAGTLYHIAVDGYSYGNSTDSGSIKLSLSFATNLPTAAPWNLPDPSGNMISSSNYYGKVVMLNFWATWCGPCVAEIPDLIQLQADYAADGLVIIGASVDSSNDGVTPPSSLVGNFGASDNINYPLVMTRPNNASVEFSYGGIAYIPSTFIIDRQNHITQSFVGSQTYSTYEHAILQLIYSNLQLGISTNNHSIRLTWPVTHAAFGVQVSSSPAGPWTSLNGAVSTDGSNDWMDVPAGNTPHYFRLMH